MAHCGGFGGDPWAYREIATGHDAMVLAAGTLADLLLGLG